MTTPLHSPAADRNKSPILDVLLQVLPQKGTALEIASGTGQHVAWFASAMPGWTWQPTDADEMSLPSITSHTFGAGLTNVRPPLLLDVTAPQWPTEDPAFAEPFDAIYCANLLHISPWETCDGLMQGVALHLAHDGALVIYGPFLEDGVPTSPGNAAFDLSLRERDPSWGIRHVDKVEVRARAHGLVLRERRAMPAHNLMLVFARA